MRILVDTCVWGDFFNGHPSTEAEALADLINGEDEICTCGVVVSEVFQGLRRDATRRKIEELFRALLFLEPVGIEPYLEAASLYCRLRKRGIAVRSTVDCLIAIIASAHNCNVLTRNKDLYRIVEGGGLGIRLWPAPRTRKDPE